MKKESKEMKIENGILKKVKDEDIINGTFVIPDSVTEIGKWAFVYCNSLVSVNISDSVTSIGDFAFEYCTSLTSVTIPDSVTSIGEGAFEYCTSLTRVNISDSVTSIGSFAFLGCTNLVSVPNNYKAFKNDMTCRGYQYKLGEWSEPIDDIMICKRGYHYCTNLYDIFNYYYGTLDKDIKIAVCEIGDKIETDCKDSKHVTNTIKPIKVLSRQEIIDILNGR